MQSCKVERPVQRISEPMPEDGQQLWECMRGKQTELVLELKSKLSAAHGCRNQRHVDGLITRGRFARRVGTWGIKTQRHLVGGGSRTPDRNRLWSAGPVDPTQIDEDLAPSVASSTSLQPTR